MNDEKKIFSRQDIESTIELLRKAGFFQHYTGLSASEIYDSLHQDRIQWASATFERYYDPGMNLAPYQVACLDENKMIYFDTEAGVMKGNDVYVGLIEGFATASGGQIQVINVTEEWESETGPITVRFQTHGKTIVFHPQYTDDWVAGELFQVVADQMQGNDRFYVCQDEQTQLGCGQDIGIIRLTKQEVELLENTFTWKFHEL